jgi:hypothetical protein
VSEGIAQSARDRQGTDDAEYTNYRPTSAGSTGAVASAATFDGHRGAEPDRERSPTAQAGGEQRGAVGRTGGPGRGGAGGHEQGSAENKHERKNQTRAEDDPVHMETDVGVGAAAETDGEPARRHDPRQRRRLAHG